MSAGGGIGMRTIWISLRAMNYTEQAFRNAVRSVNDLSKAEKAERDQLLRTLDTAKLNIQTGTLYVAMISMVAQRLGNLLSLTQVGATYMSDFNANLQELKVSFADTLFETLKPLLDVLQVFFNILKENSALRNIVVWGGLLALVIGGLYSVYLIYNGILLQNATMLKLNALLSGHVASVNTSHQLSVFGLTISYRALAGAIGAAFAGFAIAYSALQGLNPVISATIAIVLALAAAFVWLYMAHSMATLGITAALGAAAAGAAFATASNLQNQAGFAKGTRSLPSTGLFLGHKGEIVYNPMTNRPVGVQDQVMGRNEGREATKIEVTFSGDIHTKSNVDNLDDVVGKTIYRASKAST